MTSRKLLTLLSGTLIALIVPSAASAALTPDPASYDWGNVDRYQPSPLQTFKFTNNEGVEVFAQPPVIVGDPDFSIMSQDCSSAALPDGASCAVGVYVQPQSAGPLAATLTVDDGNGLTEVSLTANAQTGTLSVNPNPIDFNPQPWYFGSQFQNVNVNNSNFGTAVSSVSITGSDASLFSINFQNCTGFVMNAGNGCNLGVQFNPSAPVVADDAALVIASDSADSPNTIPLNATALSGPEPVATPGEFDFGPTEIGESSAPKAFTIANAGDFPAQIQQLLVVTGSAQTFPLVSDDCSLAIINPGDHCTFEIAFTPHTVGNREASIFLIANTPGPVTQIGLTALGLAAPGVAATISGTPAVGDDLSCDPSNANGELSYAWLRDGSPIAGASARTYTPTNTDIGSRLACRITATNPLGSSSVDSSQTAPVAPRDLSAAPHSLVSESSCRLVGVEQTRGYKISGTSPATPESPLTFEKGGDSTSFTPRRLAKLADGPQVLSVDGTDVPVTLSPCRLSVRATGAAGDQAELAISAATGMKSGSIRIPELSIDLGRGGIVGEAIVYAHGEPDTRIALSGRRTSYNGVKVELTRHGVKLKGLPADAGTVEVRLRQGVVRGDGGAVKASAKLGGAKAKANSLVSWN